MRDRDKLEYFLNNFLTYFSELIRTFIVPEYEI